MKSRSLIVMTILLLISVLGYPRTADAWAFYWSKIEVQTTSWQDCMTIAYDVAQTYHLGSLRRTGLAVTGDRDGASANVTCIGTGGNSRAMAVVMVVGDSEGPVRQLRDDLANEIHRRHIYNL